MENLEHFLTFCTAKFLHMSSLEYAALAKSMCQREWGDNVAYVEICAVTANWYLPGYCVAPLAEVVCNSLT